MQSGRGKYRSHHLGVVVEVEAVPCALGGPLHALLEASKGILAALGVGLVGGKEKQVVTALVDQPADGLGREGREEQLAVYVVGCLLGEPGQGRFGASEGGLADIEATKPWHHPQGPLLDATTPKSGVRLKYTVQH